MRLAEKFTAVAILGVAIVVGLSFMATPASDHRADSLAVRSSQLESIVKAQRVELQIVDAANDSLRRMAVIATGRYTQAKTDLRSHFALDRARDTPAPTVVLTVAQDTTQMFNLQRLSDTTVFPVPLEFVELVNAQLAAADSAWHAEHLVRVYQETYAIPMRDTLIVQLGTLAKTNKQEADLWKRKAHPRCGRKCGVALGVLGSVSAAWAASQIGRSLHGS